MNFTQFEFISLLQQNNLDTRDLLHLSFTNKIIKQTISSFFIPSGTSIMIASFVRWKKCTQDSIIQKKYRRKTSWYKKSRSEETELLCF